MSTEDKTCIVIGASHAGVNFAFALRRGGWKGAIRLIDADPILPYHRPPLSKTYLTGAVDLEKNSLKSAESYQKENIDLQLGAMVQSIDRTNKSVLLNDGKSLAYDKLVLAVGASPLIPAIPGLKTSDNVFVMRTAQDALDIQKAIEKGANRVLVIGGGYIGLETAASLNKLGAEVTVLEREERVLARVTAPEMSAFFQQLHQEKGVNVLTKKNVVAVEEEADAKVVRCKDGTSYPADMIIVGVGVRVNTELAAKAGLEIENGICVDATARTSDENIYAIGDCTFHYNPHYDRHIRLESVQNAVDQAKVAAAAICGKDVAYSAIPWFWSDQYDIKLQMVGLSTDYDQAFVRLEEGDWPRFSIWYFKGDRLLAVDAVNNAKAYVLGTKFIKANETIDKEQLMDPSIDLKPANLLTTKT